MLYKSIKCSRAIDYSTLQGMNELGRIKYPTFKPVFPQRHGTQPKSNKHHCRRSMNKDSRKYMISRPNNWCWIISHMLPIVLFFFPFPWSDLQENDHMTKVSLFHCAACQVLVSTAAVAVQNHITSPEHLSNNKVQLNNPSSSRDPIAECEVLLIKCCRFCWFLEGIWSATATCFTCQSGYHHERVAASIWKFREGIFKNMN